MWLTCSSIGRKFVMAITGVCLVLFVTFHCLMNSVAIVWPGAYNVICQFLGANWYALVASAGLALLFIIHIIYALWLTVQNRKARGADRYAVNSRPPQVEWSSKNMLVLGIVVLAFLVVHLIQFWAKMQLQELRSHELSALPIYEGMPADPQFGTIFIQMAFSQWWTVVVYLIGFIALWFHMNHGFWSMFHTVGWDNNIWIERLKKIACWWTSIVVALFIAQAVVFAVKAHEKFYTTDEALVEQYNGAFAEIYSEAVAPTVNEFVNEWSTVQQQAQATRNPLAVYSFVQTRGEYYLSKLEPIVTQAERLGILGSSQELMYADQAVRLIKEVRQELGAPVTAAPAAAPASVVPDAAEAAQIATEQGQDYTTVPATTNE